MNLHQLLPVSLLLPWTFALAGQLVYTPVNPAFGGNPLNGSTLLNSAQAQNSTKDPEQSLSRSTLDEFNQTLQRAILSRVANAISGGVVDTSGRLIPGIVETGNFRIEITDLGGGRIRITTTDKATNQVTSFEIIQ